MGAGWLAKRDGPGEEQHRDAPQQAKQNLRDKQRAQDPKVAAHQRQRLPPRQRAVLILRDVLGWARETLEKSRGRSVSQQLASHELRGLLDRYVRAWEQSDVDALVATLREDATYSMPPWRQWFLGAQAIGSFFAHKWPQYGGQRLVAIGANQQPAFAMYTRTQAGSPYLAHSIQLLSVGTAGIETITLFVHPVGPELFDAVESPRKLKFSKRRDSVNLVQ